MTDTPDPLEGLLFRPPASGAEDPLRQALFVQTARHLGRSRRRKRLLVAAAMAGCFGMGALSMRLLMPADPGNKSALVAQPAERQVRPKPEMPPPAPRGAPPHPKDRPGATAESEDTALALEWRAVESKDQRFELYRRAGDRYLEENDVESALRCYRGAVAAGSARQCAISADDNWLLMAVKQDRHKEKRHGKLGS